MKTKINYLIAVLFLAATTSFISSCTKADDQISTVHPSSGNTVSGGANGTSYGNYGSPGKLPEKK